MTRVAFLPSQTAAPPFQFQAELDGQTYNITATWGLFGARWFINVVALDGTVVVSKALIGSPAGFALQALAWLRGRALATCLDPHGLPVGQVVALTLSGVVPIGYNGQVMALVTGPDTFSFPLASDPGAASVPGAAARNVNLVSGYFTQSTLVYRQAANQFEVDP